MADPIPNTIEFNSDGTPKMSIEAKTRMDSYIKEMQEKFASMQPNMPYQVPMWIIFPNHIFSTIKIKYIERINNARIRVFLDDGDYVDIDVPDIEKTWKGLEYIFTGHERSNN